jgi:hypothetical protein
MANDSTLPDSSLPPGLLDDSTPIDTSTRFISGLSNGFERLITAATLAGIAVELFEDVVGLLGFPDDFPIPDLAGNGDLGFGGSGTGGLGNSASTIRYGTNRSPDQEISQGNIPVGWKSLDFMIKKSLTMDWQTLNADPGNPNIIEAYKISGRNYTKDGRQEQYSWAVAYVNWILQKAGLPYIETMSPYGYTKYGSPVNFRTMRDVRKYDIFIFTSILGVSHAGFIQSLDVDAGILKIIGGNQAGKVKVTDMPFSVTDPTFRVLHVKRNWSIPTDVDTSIYSLGRGSTPAVTDVLPVPPPSNITVQPLLPVGATAEEAEEFNRRYPPVSTSDPRAQVGPYTLSNARPTTQQLTDIASSSIDRAQAENIPAANSSVANPSSVQQPRARQNSALPGNAPLGPIPTSSAVVVNRKINDDLYDDIRQLNLADTSRGPQDLPAQLAEADRILAELERLGLR